MVLSPIIPLYYNTARLQRDTFSICLKGSHRKVSDRKLRHMQDGAGAYHYMKSNHTSAINVKRSKRLFTDLLKNDSITMSKLIP